MHPIIGLSFVQIGNNTDLYNLFILKFLYCWTCVDYVKFDYYGLNWKPFVMQY